MGRKRHSRPLRSQPVSASPLWEAPQNTARQNSRTPDQFLPCRPSLWWRYHRVINSTPLFQTYTVDLIFTVWIQNTQLCVCFCIVDNWCVHLPLWKCWRWYITWLENASGSPQKKPHNVAWERSVCTTLVALVWHYGQKRKEGFTISCMFLPSEMNRFKLKLNLVVSLKKWQHPIWEWHSWLLSLYLSHTRDPGNYPQL